MLLARNRSNGSIVDNSVSPSANVVFAGGSFHPFFKDPDVAAAMPPSLVAEGNVPIDLQFPLDSACDAPAQRNAGCDCDGVSAARWLFWNWTTAFQRLRRRGINLVRVFAMNGVSFKEPNAKPFDVYPFRRDTTSNRLFVQAAVEDNVWNEPYFSTYLRPFVQTADQNGIAVQLCLFSFHDLTDDNFPHFKYYPLAPWNPKGTLPEAWGETNLIPSTITHPIDRNQYFTNVNNRIINTQEKFVGRVVDSLRGLGNVIFELFNEPRSIRGTTNKRPELAAWYHRLVNFILQRAATTGWRPLISVNASDFVAGTWDIETWKANHPASFAEVDIVSYHGLTGNQGTFASPCGGVVVPVAPVHIRGRITAHEAPSGANAYPDKALMMSTDAVRNPAHVFTDSARPGAGLDLEKRDGQTRTSLSDESPLPVETLVTESDLENWAYWTLAEGYARPGQVHLQNHSIYLPAFERVATAKVKASGAGIVVQRPYPVQHSFISDPGAGRNFWWAQRHLASEGGSVTQLGTQSPPQDFEYEMTVETGWRWNFTAATAGWACFLISYAAPNVSEREGGGALVQPVIVARIHEVVSGQLRPALARTDVVVYRGAPASTIAVSGDVEAGRNYAVVFAGGVWVTYQNFLQGYGEVIVQFPSFRRVNP